LRLRLRLRRNVKLPAYKTGLAGALAGHDTGNSFGKGGTLSALIMGFAW